MTARALRYGFVAALLALLAPQGAFAQEPAPPSNDGTEEGIAVHGHWTVTVVRDGEVVDRREFENGLTLGGQAHLLNLLTRSNSPGYWAILVVADGSGTLCANNEFVVGDDTDCAISEAEAELTVSEAGTGVLLLEGSETVVRDGNLVVVETHQYECLGTTAPADCTVSSIRAQFTRRSLDSVIPVQNGDRIEVTVELSFS